MVMLLRSFLLSCCLLAPSISLAAVAEVDRLQVPEGESITLSISSEQPGGEPDFSLLSANFEIINQGQSQNISIVNGNMTKQRSWTLTLLPKQVGSIVIPSISVGNDSTQPITIEVTKPNKSNSAPSSTKAELFFEAMVDTHTPYVQSQVIYTRRFYYLTNLPLQGLDVSDLQVENAIVEPLNTKGPRYQKEINGKTYNVIEGSYAIFPEKSGELTIPAAHLRAEIGNLWQRPQAARLQSEAIVLNVQAQPNDKQPWLPAKELSIVESWNNDIQNLKVGDSITRKIVLSASGLSQAHLPEITIPSIEGLKIYADKPTSQNNVAAQGLLGQRTYTFAIVPTKPGIYTLPAIDIRWWDVDEKIEKSAQLSATTIEVAPGTMNANTEPLPTIAVTPTADIQQSISPSDTPHNYWSIIATVLFVMWLITLAIVFILYRKNTGNRPHIATEEKPRNSGRSNWAGLLQACAQNNAAETHRYLISWATQYFNSPELLPISNIAVRLPSLAAELAQLESSIYGRRPEEWRGTQLLTLLKALPRKPIDMTSEEDEPLKPLYPKL